MRSTKSSHVRRTALLALPLLAMTVACNEITSLDQSNPGSILAREIYRPANAQLLAYHQERKQKLTAV